MTTLAESPAAPRAARASVADVTAAAAGATCTRGSTPSPR